MKYIHAALFLLIAMNNMGRASAETKPSDGMLRHTLVGVWSMDASFGVAGVSSYTEMKADGTYATVGKLRLLGTTRDILEEGTWMIENGFVSTTATLTLDPKAGAHARSKILQLDQERWNAEAVDGKKKKTRVERRRVEAIPATFVERMAGLRKELKQPARLNPPASAQP